ncbi:MAG: PEP-CTERM sorting domain-containing protein [Kiritimatiellia bacterium]
MRTVTLRFQSYQYFDVSTFGTLEVDRLIVSVPEPGSLVLASLALLGGLGLAYATRKDP